MRRLELNQSVKLKENPEVIGSVIDSQPGLALVTHDFPRAIRGTQKWYEDDLLEALGNAELRWEGNG